jgi:hypothetical protein
MGTSSTYQGETNQGNGLISTRIDRIIIVIIELAHVAFATSRSAKAQASRKVELID